MQERHDRDLAEPVMLGRAWHTVWVMENLHDKPTSLPDPDIFAFDTCRRFWSSNFCTASRRRCSNSWWLGFSDPLAPPLFAAAFGSKPAWAIHSKKLLCDYCCCNLFAFGPSSGITNLCIFCLVTTKTRQCHVWLDVCVSRTTSEHSL